jgi:hypothetical protein
MFSPSTLAGIVRALCYIGNEHSHTLHSDPVATATAIVSYTCRFGVRPAKGALLDRSSNEVSDGLSYAACSDIRIQETSIARCLPSWGTCQWSFRHTCSMDSSRCLQDVRRQPHTVAHDVSPRGSRRHSSTQQRTTPTPVVSSVWAWRIPATSSRLDQQNRRDVCQYHQRLFFGLLLGPGVVSTSRLLVDWCRHVRASSFTVVRDQQRITMRANCRADEVSLDWSYSRCGLEYGATCPSSECVNLGK